MIKKFNRYGLGEWIVFIFGVLVLGTQTFRYITNTLEGTTVDGVVFVIAFLCIFVPRTLLQIIKKKTDA